MTDKTKKLCKCGCERPIRPPRRVWFSDECNTIWLTHHYIAWARPACGARDGYTCVLCGLNCQQLDQDIDRLRKAYPFGTDEFHRAIAEIDLKYGEYSRDLWQADHIIPRCEGGLDDIDNLRTLCIWCHKAETRKLTQRRTARKCLERHGASAQMDLFRDGVK